jgi:hypothetical protein
MSIPDIDYELRDLGQFEYSVGLATPSSPEDMEFVAQAFRAGQEKERERIYNTLTNNAKGYENMYISLYNLRKIIYND